MVEKVQIKGQSYNPNEAYLYYYDRWDCRFWKGCDIEFGREYQVYDLNGDRVISFDELQRNADQLKELVHHEGIYLFTAPNAQAAVRKLFPIQWKWNYSEPPKIKSYIQIEDACVENRFPPQPLHPVGISPKAEEDIQTINLSGFDFNRDGYPDLVDLQGEVLFGYSVSLHVYWGTESGSYVHGVIKAFNIGQQVKSVEWNPETDPLYDDLGSFMVRFEEDPWRTEGTLKISAYNSAPPRGEQS